MEKKNYVNKNIYELSYTMRQERGRRIRNIVLSVLMFFVLLNALLFFLVAPIKQQSISMEPNIKKNSFLLTTPRALYAENNLIRRGEIVLVEHTQNEQQFSILKKVIDIVCRAVTLQKVHPFSKENAFLSRVAALPGDTIYMKDFVLYVIPSGENFSYTEFELNQIPYSIDIRVPPAGWNTQIGVRGNFEKTTLSANEYFVLCDNRISSMDSRIFGAVQKDQIKRKVLISYFPFNAFKIFRARVKK